MASLLYIAKKRIPFGNYAIEKGELVDITHILIEIGKGSKITFNDMRKNTFTLDDKRFYSSFSLDTILEGDK